VFLSHSDVFNGWNASWQACRAVAQSLQLRLIRFVVFDPAFLTAFVAHSRRVTSRFIDGRKSTVETGHLTSLRFLVQSSQHGEDSGRLGPLSVVGVDECIANDAGTVNDVSGAER
jgi:hypothetical protein